MNVWLLLLTSVTVIDHTKSNNTFYAVLCNDSVAFRKRFPTQSIQIIGNIDFNFSKDQEILQLYDSSAFLIDKFSYARH